MGTAIIQLTKGVRWVSSADIVDDSIKSSADETLEVLGYRSMRLTLKLWELTASGANVSFKVQMETGMNLTDPDAFTPLGVFDFLDEGPVAVQRVFTDLQRYVRWRIVGFEDIDNAQFSIEGVAYE